jgi:hypothetical protein
MPGHSGRGHRPCHSATLILGPPGAQSPRPAPAPPPAGASRPPGRALAFVAPGPAGLRGTVMHGRGNAVRFRVPPGLGAELHRCHGRGHRPCHSATLIPGPPGAQSPRPAPAPPSAGASRPPGRALASVGAGGTGLGGSVPRGRGKRGAFPGPARTGGGRSESEPPTPLQWQGPSPLPQRHADPRPAGGPKPPASARPDPVGAGLPLVRIAPVLVAVSRRGGGNAVRFPRPQGQSLSPDWKDFRGRRSDCFFSTLLTPSGNRTVKTSHRSVFSQSSGRTGSSVPVRFPERYSPIVLGLHPVTPTSARHKTAMRCFHQSSSCSSVLISKLLLLWG